VILFYRAENIIFKWKITVKIAIKTLANENKNLVAVPYVDIFCPKFHYPCPKLRGISN
jgi:hypothetical protein